MTEIIKIAINEIPKFIMPDGSVCYGDSDGVSFYDPEKDIVYFPYCENCKSPVHAVDVFCRECGANLEGK
jgi:hypothetical protein